MPAGAAGLRERSQAEPSGPHVAMRGRHRGPHFVVRGRAHRGPHMAVRRTASRQILALRGQAPEVEVLQGKGFVTVLSEPAQCQ